MGTVVGATATVPARPQGAQEDNTPPSRAAHGAAGGPRTTSDTHTVGRAGALMLALVGVIRQSPSREGRLGAGLVRLQHPPFTSPGVPAEWGRCWERSDVPQQTDVYWSLSLSLNREAWLPRCSSSSSVTKNSVSRGVPASRTTNQSATCSLMTWRVARSPVSSGPVAESGVRGQRWSQTRPSLEGRRVRSAERRRAQRWRTRRPTPGARVHCRAACSRASRIHSTVVRR